MKCPFLRDARVRFCQASAYRKMIVESGPAAGEEVCTSPRHLGCPAAASRLAAGEASASRCPFLQDAHVEFCAASPVPKFVPASDGLLSHCSSDAHLYCEVYLNRADPEGDRLPAESSKRRTVRPSERTPLVDGIPVPAHLSYAPNHMWLDVSEDGHCHVGIDAFLAHVIGPVEKVSFVTSRATECPVAVLTVAGVDLQMVFPNPLHGTTANAYLRTNTSKLTDDPYGAGWLFEGVEPAHRGSSAGDAARTGLIDGASAVEWFRAENDRLTALVHERMSQPGPDGSVFMADGGKVAAGIAAHLDRDELINLFNDFFSLRAGWRRSE